MCPIETWTRPVEVMKLELFSRIMDQLAPYRDDIAYIVLNGCGEPLLDKKIGDKIALARSRGFAGIQLSTNATELRDAVGEGLLEAGLNRLIISIDGATKETHEAIRKRTNWGEIVDNAERFIARRDAGRYGTEVWIRMIGQPLNDHEWPDYEAYWSSRIDPDRGDRVAYFRAHNWGRESGIEGAAPKEAKITYCEDLWSRVYIHADGAIALCCVDDDGWFEIGNIRDVDAVEMLNSSPVFLRHRSLMASGRTHELDHCRHCVVPLTREQTNYRQGVRAR